MEYLTSFNDPKRQEGLCCVPGDGSKHAGDCGQAQFERVQLTHDYPLQVKALQILQTSHTHTHSAVVFTFSSTFKCQLKNIIKTLISVIQLKK